MLTSKLAKEDNQDGFETPKKTRSPIKKLVLKRVKTPERITYEIIRRKADFISKLDVDDNSSTKSSSTGVRKFSESLLEESYSENSINSGEESKMKIIQKKTKKKKTRKIRNQTKKESENSTRHSFGLEESLHETSSEAENDPPINGNTKKLKKENINMMTDTDKLTEELKKSTFFAEFDAESKESNDCESIRPSTSNDSCARTNNPSTIPEYQQQVEFNDYDDIDFSMTIEEDPQNLFDIPGNNSYIPGESSFEENENIFMPEYVDKELSSETEEDDNPFESFPKSPLAIKLVPMSRKTCPKYLKLNAEQVKRILPKLQNQ